MIALASHLSLYIYIYIYICVCVCVCVFFCLCAFFLLKFVNMKVSIILYEMPHVRQILKHSDIDALRENNFNLNKILHHVR
jgi:hypothetical protein